jgi:2-haloacid dehalogenase
MMKLSNLEVLTFDCYGTLIDWESGIWNALEPVLARRGIKVQRDRALELFGKIEFEIQCGEFKDYRTVLRRTMEGICITLGFAPSEADLSAFPDSLGQWPAFSDTVGALKALKRKYKLAIVSNVDDDLFGQSLKHLQVEFDWIVTAQQVKSYKPSLVNFQLAIERIGVPIDKILHVAQSLFHDVVPAQSLGLSTVWVNRRHDKDGFGATVPVIATPDLEVPDLQTLARILGD